MVVNGNSPYFKIGKTNWHNMEGQFSNILLISVHQKSGMIRRGQLR
jgi:hypothetical protein